MLKLLDFGAIVSLLPGKDGLLHISQIAHERVNAVGDFLKEGQVVKKLDFLSLPSLPTQRLAALPLVSDQGE